MYPQTRSAPPVGLICILALILLSPLVLGSIAGNAAQAAAAENPAAAAKGRRSGTILPEVVGAPAGKAVSIPSAGPSGFTPQVRLGYTNGDQWEPAIAADNFGHVYVMYPQYFGVPGCPTCGSPTMILITSSDGGSTWAAPRVLYPSNSPQWDPQIVVDPADGRTLYVSWMENSKSDIYVSKSTDFGQTWTHVRADFVSSGTDKPILAVYGQHVYVAFNHSNAIYFSVSHNGGQSFSQTSKRTGNLGWSLPGGGVVMPNGDAYFSWNGYMKSGSTTGDVNLYLTKTTNGGSTWNYIEIDVSGAPPQCPEYSCGWAYLGAAITMDADTSGNLYVLYNMNLADGQPGRIFFRKSTNGGSTWSARTEVSTAASGIHHNFPAIDARGNGDVRVTWMDGRANHEGTPVWNTYYRSSANGGSTWTSEVDISTYVAGLDTYIFPEGFRFPFGDYYEIAIDNNGKVHVVTGQGFSYDSPGSIWYTQGQ